MEFVHRSVLRQPLHDYSNLFSLSPKLDVLAVAGFEHCVMVSAIKSIELVWR